MIALLIIFFAGAYIAGSINFSIILFKILGKEDPRNNFSGNAGATNVYRQAGIFWALTVLLLDMGRAMLIAYASLCILNASYITWPGLALILGNRYPCFHNFKGGKGIANYLGFTFVLAPLSACVASLAWGLVYLFFRTPFISSFVMTAILAVGTINIFLGSGFGSGSGSGFDSGSAVIATSITALFIFFNHRDNVMQKLKK